MFRRKVEFVEVHPGVIVRESAVVAVVDAARTTLDGHRFSFVHVLGLNEPVRVLGHPADVAARISSGETR